MSDPRTDEALFRGDIPDTIDGIEIVTVGKYSPGGDATYPSAITVTKQADRWSTHILIYNTETGAYFLNLGHYDLATQAAAEADAAART